MADWAGEAEFNSGVGLGDASGFTAVLNESRPSAPTRQEGSERGRTGQ